MTRRVTNWQSRFWKSVDRKGPQECWIWIGTRLPKGYGSFTSAQCDENRAHRVSWLIANGPIPPGLCVCHRCDTPPCVNPAHLFLGTKSENTKDRHSKGRSAQGSRNGRAKLNSQQVFEIRFRLKNGESQRRLARLFKVHPRTVCRIGQREIWSWF